jgi:23S rRNA (guanosine2251-2'-O)-methyltransferase
MANKRNRANRENRSGYSDSHSFLRRDRDGYAADGSPDRIEGRNPVLEALRAGRTINKILTAKGEREGSIKQIIAIAKEKGIVLQEVDRGSLDAISSTQSHQGVIAFAAAKNYVDVDDILNIAKSKQEPAFLIILDGVTDPNNFGSILRTADAVGVHGVIIPKRRAVGLTPTVSKVSAGAIEYVPVARVTNIVQTIEYLKNKNIWIIGTDASGEKLFSKSDMTGPVALVIGSEGKGMGRLVREKCDFVVSIPMKGSVTSLNTAVAGAVVLYEILRQKEG